MHLLVYSIHLVLFFKQKTAYEMRISDWSSDVCSSDLDSAGLEMSKAQLLAIGLAVYLFAMWSVHTVQYNTAMMFVWNKKYIHDQVEIGKRKHIEERKSGV